MRLKAASVSSPLRHAFASRTLMHHRNEFVAVGLLAQQGIYARVLGNAIGTKAVASRMSRDGTQEETQCAWLQFVRS
jgi:hypothetical protein